MATSGWGSAAIVGTVGYAVWKGFEASELKTSLAVKRAERAREQRRAEAEMEQLRAQLNAKDEAIRQLRAAGGAKDETIRELRTTIAGLERRLTAPGGTPEQ